MPGRSARRKVDPAALEAKFNEWKRTDAYAMWEELRQEKQNFKRMLSVTSKDLTDYKEEFLQKLHNFVVYKRVPHRSQSYEQIVLRTAFFPHTTLDYKFAADGKEFELSKELVDLARSCREAFCKILDALNSIRDADENSFQQIEKDMVKLLTDFEKKYMLHVKKAHDFLFKNVLFVILRPLWDTVEANIHLYYLENRAHPKKAWFKDSAPDFRIRACRTKFCETMTVLIKVLKDHGNLIGSINVAKSLQKFEIDTEESKVFKAFVNPVKKAWRVVRSRLKELYKAKIERFKMPLLKNKPIFQALQELIHADELAEMLLGDDLKKDQLKFIYDVITHVHNSPLREALLDDDPNVIKEVVPEVATFRALVQMSEVTNEIEDKERELREVGLELEGARADRSQSSIWSMDREVRYEGIRRKWVWEGYIRDSERIEWEAIAQEVRQVNFNVQEDILDYFIARKIKHPGQPPQEVRPPYVWNHLILNNKYVTIEERLDEEEDTRNLRINLENQKKRKFRSYVRPMECYVDGRVDHIVDRVGFLSLGLQGHQNEAWDMLVTEVIKVFKQDLPESGEDDISVDDELQQVIDEEVKEEIKADFQPI